MTFFFILIISHVIVAIHHVVNLPLTENNILCQLFFKGPKYMKSTSINFHDDIYINFLSDIH